MELSPTSHDNKSFRSEMGSVDQGVYYNGDVPSASKREKNVCDNTIERDKIGNSLSPYLFILVADVLSRRMEQRVSRNEIVSIKSMRTCSEIHHLLFVDDSLFFLKGSVENAQALKSTVDKYCKASGQMVNLSKSSLLCGGDEENTFTTEVATLFGMNLVTDSGKFLGLPSLWGRSKCEALRFLKERIVNKLQGWRSKLLNNAGKEVLIKAVISAIPTFSMSVFKLLKT